MHPHEIEDRDFHYSSDREWDLAEALQLGSENPDRPWIHTDRDVWHANPFYHGPPVPHPEDDDAWEEFWFIGPRQPSTYVSEDIPF